MNPKPGTLIKWNAPPGLGIVQFFGIILEYRNTRNTCFEAGWCKIKWYKIKDNKIKKSFIEQRLYPFGENVEEVGDF